VQAGLAGEAHTLAALLQGVTVRKLFATGFGTTAATHDVTIARVCYDSRAVQRGDLFVAMRGTAQDGHAFVTAALDRGAAAVVLEDDAAAPDPLFMHHHAVKVVVPDARTALAVMAANIHGRPGDALKLVAVTGTNGKTTTTHLVRAMLEAGGERSGLVGTIAHSTGGAAVAATHTTPESLELHGLLAAMVRSRCTAAVMEVSSHALAMERVHGLVFAAAAFTNLTQDHLDYHGSMEEYFRAKKKLFDMLPRGSVAVTNAEDAYGAAIVVDTPARRLSYAVDRPADAVAREVRMDVRGTRFTIEGPDGGAAVETRLIGGFNVRNILAAWTLAAGLGVPPPARLAGIAAVGAVRGRFEQIASPAGWTAVVDYAHTPDALENCLRAIRGLLPAGGPGRVITVFGCGGNRDRGKRPRMGAIAAGMSDATVVTSDNPRREDPGAIIREILAGVPPGRAVVTEPDRRAAIRRALGMAEAGDVVLVAGKGHEDYQVVGDRRVHFDDREEVETFIREHA